MSRYNHKHKLGFKAYFYRTLFSAIAIAAGDDQCIAVPLDNKGVFFFRKDDV